MLYSHPKFTIKFHGFVLNAELEALTWIKHTLLYGSVTEGSVLSGVGLWHDSFNAHWDTKNLKNMFESMHIGCLRCRMALNLPQFTGSYITYK